MRSKIVGEMHRAGVRILAGTDAGAPYAVPGFSLHDELKALVDAGLTPLEALRTATLNAAIFMNARDRFGTVRKRQTADLVLLDANPLEEIGNTRRIAAVVLNGRYLPASELDQLLQFEANLAATR